MAVYHSLGPSGLFGLLHHRQPVRRLYPVGCRIAFECTPLDAIRSNAFAPRWVPFVSAIKGVAVEDAVDAIKGVAVEDAVGAIKGVAGEDAVVAVRGVAVGDAADVIKGVAVEDAMDTQVLLSQVLWTRSRVSVEAMVVAIVVVIVEEMEVVAVEDSVDAIKGVAVEDAVDAVKGVALEDAGVEEAYGEVGARGCFC